MKIFLSVFLLSLTLANVAITQDYERLKAGFGVGIAWPMNGNPGAFITFEPAYRGSDDLAFGLRIEGGIFGVSDNADPMGSLTINGQLYLSGNTFRPFIGSGLGLYRYGSFSYVTQYGFYPRVGIDMGHFTLSLDYNILPGAKTYTHLDVSSYVHLRMGFFIGGGKR